jgi:NADPH:quinone reductase-like Zn-dependent oxidoreductase
VFAVYAAGPNPSDPLAALRAGERPDPEIPSRWVLVTVRAASLNMHDVSILRGAGMRPEQFPVILGCDGAGVLEDGTEVVIHSSIGDPAWSGPETLDPGRTVLTEKYPGAFADRVAVPAGNALPKPTGLSFAEAACLPTAWLTAYRMLFVHSGLRPGQVMLLDGRLGSIAVALLQLGRTAGMRVWVIAHRDADRALAKHLGADLVLAPGSRPAEAADAAFDAGVDIAAWSHRTGWVRPGGAIVCAGYRSGTTTTGYAPDALERLIFGELRLLGCAMGTREDLKSLMSFLDATGLRPRVALTLPLDHAPDGFRAMLGGEVTGKIVFTREGGKPRPQRRPTGS